MLRFSARKAIAPETTPGEPPGPHLLRDRGLFAEWYIRWRLDEEMARSARYRYPLTLAVLEPQLPPGLALPRAAVAVGALVADTVSRSTDLLGWFGDGCILAILPHSNGAEAAAAIERWRSEITSRSWHVAGGVKWRIAAAASASEFASGASFLDAARQRLRTAA